MGQAFRRAGAEFQPYDLRHSWAVRAIHNPKISASLAAKSMGHSLAVHSSVYQRWFDAHEMESLQAELSAASCDSARRSPDRHGVSQRVRAFGGSSPEGIHHAQCGTFSRPVCGTLARHRSMGRAGGVLISNHQTIATFLRLPEMLLSLADFIGSDATPEQAESLFDILVMRGLLLPWEHYFWEIAILDPAEVRGIVRSLTHA